MSTPQKAKTWTDFFPSSLPQTLQLPTDQGTALPNIAYTGEDFYRFEQETVFARTWVFAAFVHQFENVGDMVPVEIAGQPVVIVKSAENQFKAFHNVCRHRGAKLIQEDKKAARRFICPNHSWSYSLEGKLLARPHFHGGGQHDVNKDPSTCHRADLAEIRIAVWLDWIFINMDGQAPDFDSHVSFITERLEGYALDELQYCEKMEFEIKANWKLAIENFIEPYHVFSCHPWLNDFVGMDERTPPDFKDHVLFCGYDFKDNDPARGGALPHFSNLSETKQKRGDWFVLFPNFCFEIFPDQVDVFIATPNGAEATTETIALYFVGEGATDSRYQEARQHVVKNWHDLNVEDVGVIERMQAGRHSDGFDGGVLSPYWDPVQQQFARLILNSIQ